MWNFTDESFCKQQQQGRSTGLIGYLQVPPPPPPPPHPHLGGLLPAPDGVVLEGELVLADDGAAVLVPDVRHHVHVGRPHLNLTLPVDDGGERRAHQERALGVALWRERGRGRGGEQPRGTEISKVEIYE